MAGQFYAPGAALVPPHQGSHLSPSPLAHTLQLHRGDTMYLYSSTQIHGFDRHAAYAILNIRASAERNTFRGGNRFVPSLSIVRASPGKYEPRL